MPAMRTNPEEYLNVLLGEIERAKSYGRRQVYRISDRLHKNVVNYITSYFNGHTDKFEFEIKLCKKCKAQYDVIITIL